MLLNPTFSDPGATAGEAAHWTLRTLCQAQRIAGFGPAPERAQEDFERWFALRTNFAQGDVAMAMFDALAEGIEDFEEGWNDGPLLTELSGGLVDPGLFAGNDFDDMQSGWLTSPFVSSWHEVVAQPAEFAGEPFERFDGWFQMLPATWQTAAFDGANAERFDGVWTPMQTL
jgi:hypothetical protein